MSDTAKGVVFAVAVTLLVGAAYLAGRFHSAVAELDAWAAARPGRVYVIEGVKGGYTVRLKVNAGTKDELECYATTGGLESSVRSSMPLAEKHLSRHEK